MQILNNFYYNSNNKYIYLKKKLDEVINDNVIKQYKIWMLQVYLMQVEY